MLRNLTALVGLTVLTLFSSLSFAHSVGQIDTAVYYDDASLALILAGGGSLAVGDELTYIIEFMPVENGATVGAGGYVTAYVPPGTEVIGAEHVRRSGAGFTVTGPSAAGPTWTGTGGGDNTYTGWAPADAATVMACTAAGFLVEECNGRMMQVYADTGVFYSTDARTALFVGPDVDGVMRADNGYHVDPSAEGQLTGIVGVSDARTHNLWDASQTNAFGGDTPTEVPASPAPSFAGRGTTPFNAGSPVAGVDSGYQLDNTGNVGPWLRIAHPGSTIGTTADGPTDQNGVVGVYGDPTAAGYNLSAANPLPAGTNAVRWATGQIIAGEVEYVRLRLRVTQAQTGFGVPLATEVFGGDSANAGGKDNKDNPWRYHVPSIAVLRDAGLYVSIVITEVDGAPYTGGPVPPMATVKYRVTYANLTNMAIGNVALNVDLPAETQNCPVDEASFVVVSGPNILPHTPTCANGLGAGDVLGFQSFSLAAGQSGVIEFEMLANGGDDDLVINEAMITSPDVPDPASARSIFTIGAEAYLDASASVSPQFAAQSDTVRYTLSVTNTGNQDATDIVLRFILPGVGSQATERFAYVAASSSVVGLSNVAPVATVPSTIAPYSGENRQELLWDFGGDTLAVGATATITLDAVIGSAVPSSPPDYASGMIVDYDNGDIADANFWAPLVAPVTVGVPNLDMDADGVNDDVDVDDDGDGIADLAELPAAFGAADPGADEDNDGTPNYRDPDYLSARGLQPEDLDADGDGRPNHLDRDSDADGVTDAWEADGSDANGDGVRDGCFPAAADGECMNGPATPRNTDMDLSATPDFLDPDTDDDGVLDSVEGHDVDGDGTADVLPSGSDSDNDGLDDAYDPDCAMVADCGGVIGAPAPLPDSNGVGDANILEVCGDGYVAAFEACDDGDADDANACTNMCLINLGEPCSNDPACDSGICNQAQGICSVCDDDASGSTADRGCMLPTAICDETGVPTCVTCVDDTNGNTDSGCLAGAPTCDSMSRTCLPCEDSAAGNGTDNGCTNANPLCDESGAVPICVECLDNTHCPGRFCGPLDTCVECLIDQHCPGTDVCGPGNTCVGQCATDVDCTDPTVPVCAPAGVCVECLLDADCLGGSCVGMVCQPPDSDGDGVPDAVDLDDDNDGIPDLREVPANFGADPSADADLDGVPNWQDADFLTPLGLAAADVDLDMDGIPNHLDLDSDYDGIVDIVEAGGTDANGDGRVDGFFDNDNDGLDDAVAAAPLPVPDTDTDNAPDFLDVDSDDDGLADAAEGHDVDHDGVADVLPAAVDTDLDGLDDAFDVDCAAAGDCGGVIGTVAPLPDLDADTRPNFRDVDDDEDGRDTADEIQDAVDYIGPAANPNDVDGDGLPNWYDIDSDADNLSDALEIAMGLDPDGNGIPEYLDPLDGGDADFDGVADADECPAPGSIDAGTCRDSDDDGTPDYLDVDDDNDGILTRDELLYDGPDGVAVNDLDWDDDGTPNHLDLDSDADGIPDIVENGDRDRDADGDGRVDAADDADGDGLAAVFDPDDNAVDLFDRPMLLDTDGDDHPDPYDRDADGDGITDATEAGAEDSDGDGVADDDGPFPIPDTDGDGIPDFQDVDADGDGVADATEGHDADGDGSPDVVPMSADENGDGIDDAFDEPATLPDLDGDDTPDWRDVDDDGDGVPTAVENPDPDGDGDTTDAQDTDGDGTPDYLDIDDDGDGVYTQFEAPDPDGDGDPIDGQDTDGDGIPDYLDADDDDDGIDTIDEEPDPNGDGNPDDARDSDGNGVPDYLDADDDDDDDDDTPEGSNFLLSGGCGGCSSTPGNGNDALLWLVVAGGLAARRRRARLTRCGLRDLGRADQGVV